jgi:SAM-dependent methyltransferase
LDLLKTGFPPSSFDLIIGNSFLHHLHDLPNAIQELHRLLRPGGMFATLHEPTPVAIAYESGSWDLICQFRRQGAAYVELLRKGKAVADDGVIDVWLFEGERLATLFRTEGFEAIRVIPWNLLRPILVARSKLHLDALKPALSPWEQILFAVAILTDAGLRRCFPAHVFGSLSLAASKPLC